MRIRTSHFFLAGACVALFALTAPASAAILRVPSEYPTIQSAINAASDRDVIIVAPGNYVERINYNGKDVSVVSAKGPDVTTIEGPAIGQGSLVTFRNGESGAAVLDGFTLTGGSGTFLGHAAYGGAIVCINATPTIVGNRFVDNQNDSLVMGAGIYCLDTGAAPYVESCVFEGNEARFSGGAVAARFGASITLVDCRFEDNAPNALYTVDCSAEVIGCVFERNSLGGAQLQVGPSAVCDIRVEGCRFSEHPLMPISSVISSSLSTLSLVGNVIEKNDAGALYFPKKPKKPDDHTS